jgi:hypothetical protein
LLVHNSISRVFDHNRVLAASSIINNTLHKINQAVAVYRVHKASINHSHNSSRDIVVVRQVVHRHLDRNSIAVNVQETSVHEPASITLKPMESHMGCVQ